MVSGHSGHGKGLCPNFTGHLYKCKSYNLFPCPTQDHHTALLGARGVVSFSLVPST